MPTSEWVFLDHPVLALQDIEAAITHTGVDSNRTTFGYAIRVALPAYREAVASQNILWVDISRRLQEKNLILLPALPSLSELIADPSIDTFLQSDVMCLNPAKFSDRLVPATSQCIEQIRQSELSHIVHAHQGQAILTLQNGHFVLPSGAHTSHFFRLAECLSSIEYIDTLSYWIARDIHLSLNGREEKSLLLIVDHPSMLVLATRVIQALPKIRIKIEAIKEYPGITIGENEFEQWIRDRVTNSDAVHCVIGVSSTGTLSQIVRRASEANQCNASFSIIYSTTSNVASNAFCKLDIEHYDHFTKDEACSLCNDTPRGTRFYIDPSRYFIHEQKQEVVYLPPPLFGAQRRFLEAYGEIEGALKVHIDDPNDETRRHHAFYVNVVDLLACAEFADEVIGHIQRIQPKPDLVVIPPHPAGHMIEKLIRANFDMPVYLHRDLRLDVKNPIDAALAEVLSAADSLLIVDDLAFTGRRLHTFNGSLREANGAFKAPQVVNFFPIIALPENLDEWSKFERGLCGNHPNQTQKLIPLYTLQIPHWGKDHCPWCAESRQIERLPPFSNEDDSDERGNLLADTDAGLYGNGWVNSCPGEKVPVLGAKSPLLGVGASSMQTLFACASAVQQARSRKDRPINRKGFPLSYVIDSGVIKDFTNETLFVIALLRSLLTGEVSDEFRLHVARLAVAAANTEPHNKWALRELLLSITRGLSIEVPEHDRKKVYDSANFTGYLSLDA